MMMQLITSSASEFPVGTFNVENTYDYVYPVGNTLSGKPILNVGGATRSGWAWVRGTTTSAEPHEGSRWRVPGRVPG